MATADVRALNIKTRRQVSVIGRDGRRQRSEVFDGNPRITAGVSPATLVNGPGARPYIMARSDTRWVWRRDRDQQPGEIYLNAEERKFGARFAGFLMVEPNIKANGNVNKSWPFHRWQAVVDKIGGKVVQCGREGTRWLSGVERVETLTFRRACGVLAACRAFVGTEGALHHAAAALGVRAVVLWSEFISPDVTGYSCQTNIRHAGEPCGARVPCATCAASMDAIGVDEVCDALRVLQ